MRRTCHNILSVVASELKYFRTTACRIWNRNMDQLRPFADRRLVAYCVHCASSNIETRDHCPSRILLDEPHLENLPVLRSCASCNSGFSLDEEYFACLVECARTGSTEAVRRRKVRRALDASPALVARLMHARSIGDNGAIIFSIEQDRVRNVVLKLARGHAAFELSEPQYSEPSHIMFTPLHLLTVAARQHFETPPEVSVWPEVGSRAMQRMVVAEDAILGPEWNDVQPGQYRYLAVAQGAVMIRFVVGEFLACEVIWDDNDE
jgi:hypothetical protein